MDNVNGGGKNEKGKKRRIFPFSEILAAALEKRKGDPLAIFTDISVFILKASLPYKYITDISVFQ